MTGAHPAGPVRDTGAMIAGMAPALRPGSYVFCTTGDAGIIAAALPQALAVCREDEGMSLILPVAVARALGLPDGPEMAWITLTVNSALDGVGLTAAVAAALAGAGIPCNVVAAYHHDHILVPCDQAQQAMATLRRRAAAG